MPRAELKIQSSPSGAEANDVIAALVSTGYKKQIAAEATWACDASERTTIEDWTRAALRRARA
jgi:Holliday junction resolvasome RuvABC DNA-binding subunit